MEALVILQPKALFVDEKTQQTVIADGMTRKIARGFPS